MPLARAALVPLLMFTLDGAYGATTTVYPTGVNATDIQNVQAALNQGGNVLLKAVNKAGQPQAFNFGTWPDTGTIPANAQVILTANVAISGEQVGSNRTTIQGGVAPFYEANTAVKASISGLKFVNPQAVAIAIWRSAGITIQNNEVDDVTPFLDSGSTQTLGLFVGGAGNATITGPVVISGNYIHGIDAPYEFGIQVNSVESAMTIVGNTIVIGDATDAAAGSVDSEGIEVAGCSGAATVSGNNVSVGPGVCYNGIVARGPQTGAVTVLGNEVTIAENATCYAGIGMTGSTGTVNVLANLIDSQSELASGIYLEGTSYSGTVTGATIALNAIDIENSEFSAIELGGAATKCSVSLNLISGQAAYALSATNDGIPTDICSANSFLSNLLLGFTATDATVFLDTNTVNNVVRTSYKSVINNGTGNQVSQ